MPAPRQVLAVQNVDRGFEGRAVRRPIPLNNDPARLTRLLFLLNIIFQNFAWGLPQKRNPSASQR